MFLYYSIHDYNSEYASFEEVSRFYEALQQQLARVYEFNIEKGQLMRIKTPTLTISNETKLMAKTGRVLNYVLKFLYEGSAVIDTCAPTLSVEPDWHSCFIYFSSAKTSFSVCIKANLLKCRDNFASYQTRLVERVVRVHKF